MSSLAAGELFGERIGSEIVRERGLRGWRAYEARQMAKQRMKNIGAAGGAAWGALIGAEIDIVADDGQVNK